MYAACLGEVDGIRLLSGDTVSQVLQPASAGLDAVIDYETRYSLGFQLPFPFRPMSGEGAFGHYGLGRSTGFAGTRRGFAFGYAVNQMGRRRRRIRARWPWSTRSCRVWPFRRARGAKRLGRRRLALMLASPSVTAISGHLRTIRTQMEQQARAATEITPNGLTGRHTCIFVNSLSGMRALTELSCCATRFGR